MITEAVSNELVERINTQYNPEYYAYSHAISSDILKIEIAHLTQCRNSVIIVYVSYRAVMVTRLDDEPASTRAFMLTDPESIEQSFDYIHQIIKERRIILP